MDNIKDDKYYLEKILTDLNFIIVHTEGLSKEEIEEADLLIDAVMFRIVQIAEHNGKLSDSFKKSHPEVPWAAIKGMRNLIVHNYGVVRLDMVYDTIANGIPTMYNQLKNLL